MPECLITDVNEAAFDIPHRSLTCSFTYITLGNCFQPDVKVTELNGCERALTIRACLEQMVHFNSVDSLHTTQAKVYKTLLIR